ncbi:MAG: trimeric intracellular cation channel family protein [Clostridia bacterium]|nr:trimeric intracellular cation channel family protein [Clostridia bacterium]
MEIPEIILLIHEIVGTISFAVSGAFVAIKVKFDIFGVLVIGCITAVGGGITRDMLIGATPPAVFSKLYVVAIAAATSLMVFIVAYINRKKFDEFREKIEHMNNVFDAFGLATFSVAGTEIAFASALSDNAFLAITLGVLTGCGGGVLRDILTETQPYIFKKHIYAIASISGAGIYYLLRLFSVETLVPSLVGMSIIVVLRLLAAKYKWSLPKIKLNEGSNGKTIAFKPNNPEENYIEPTQKFGE